MFADNCIPQHERRERDEWHAVLRQELAEVRRHLEMLSTGQAALMYAVGNLKGTLGTFLPAEAATPREQPLSGEASDLPSFQEAGTEDDLLKEESSMKETATTCNTEDLAGSDLQPPEDGLHRSVARTGSSLQRACSAAVRKNLQLTKLERILTVNDEATSKQTESNIRYEKAWYTERFKLLRPEKRDLIMDSFVSTVIFFNAIFIGFSADNWDGEIDSIYCVLDVIFGVIFLAELFIKLRVNGWRRQYLGNERYTNIFDAILVFLDTLQLLLVFFARDATESMKASGIPSASLFRIVRVMRITRVLRILRHPAFEELLAMMEGTMGGVTTLGWALVTFGLVLYVMALLCRDIFGQQLQYELVADYFINVPRSMFTVFRCSFGDCSTEFGTPIPEFIHKEFGVWYSTMYSLFVFFITIGLFNVISAIFVGSVIKRGEDRSLMKLQERLTDEQLWATRVCAIMRRCLLQAGHLTSEQGKIENSMLDAEIPRLVLDDLCQHDEVVKASLNDLDIDEYDHAKLSDILDPDHNGCIALQELVGGLYRLRGAPRRSDTITIDLMLRASQEKLDDIYEMLYMRNGFSWPSKTRVRYHV